jgi:hypothetical protein
VRCFLFWHTKMPPRAPKHCRTEASLCLPISSHRNDTFVSLSYDVYSHSPRRVNWFPIFEGAFAGCGSGGQNGFSLVAPYPDDPNVRCICKYVHKPVLVGAQNNNNRTAPPDAHEVNRVCGEVEPLFRNLGRWYS